MCPVEEDQPSPTQVIHRDRLSYKKSHASRTGCRECLCEIQTPFHSAQSLPLGLWGFALRGHSEHLQWLQNVSSGSHHPAQPCAHLRGSCLFPVPLGAVPVPRHTLHSPVFPGGASCGSWLQSGTEAAVWAVPVSAQQLGSEINCYQFIGAIYVTYFKGRFKQCLCECSRDHSAEMEVPPKSVSPQRCAQQVQSVAVFPSHHPGCLDLCWLWE